MPDDNFISEDTVEAVRNVEECLKDILQTIERIEITIKENSFAELFRQLQPPIFLIVLLYVATSFWHSKWRYVAQYQVSPKKVSVAREPHDCDLFYAPIGEKFCSYDPKVSTVYWARTPADGQPIFSTDDGKTWGAFTPEAGAVVPRSSTVEQVNVDWEKKDN